MKKEFLVDDKIWDVAVIGGGPAGMMAAGRAAERGRSVLLLEKNRSLGKKLLITGGGRCNVTNNKTNVHALIAEYKGNVKFLYSAFARFGVAETLEFFRKRGMRTKEENDGRIFPVSDTARSVRDVLARYMEEGGVCVQSGMAVAGLESGADGVMRIRLANGMFITARSCVLATGGTSHPETGSTGEGFDWLRALGHTVSKNDASLVPVALYDAWAKRLSGVTLDNVRITVRQDGRKYQMKKGRILFTHFGVSGPVILNMSRTIGSLLSHGPVELAIDIFPGVEHGVLRGRLLELLERESNKKLKNVLHEFVPQSLVLPLIELSGADGDAANHAIRKETRTAIIDLCKALPLSVSGLLGADKAIVSSGGVSPREVDFRTMESRVVARLYLVGDALDIDRPSGGYSLQLCWTTGFVAGDSA